MVESTSFLRGMDRGRGCFALLTLSGGSTLGSGGFGSRVKSLNTQWVPRRPATGASWGFGDCRTVCGDDLTFCRDSCSPTDGQYRQSR
jgi:hypothetical protein